MDWNGIRWPVRCVMRGALVCAATIVLALPDASGKLLVLRDVERNLGIPGDLGGADTEGFVIGFETLYEASFAEIGDIRDPTRAVDFRVAGSVDSGLLVNWSSRLPGLLDYRTRLFAGGDEASMEVLLLGGGAESGPVLHAARAAELQVLEFIVDPGLGITTIPVEMTYSQSASVATVGLGENAVGARSSLSILDASTFDVDAGDVFAPFVSQLDVVGGAAASAGVIDQTVALELPVNTRFWVLQEVTSVMDLIGDLSGASAEILAFSDPVFRVSPDFGMADAITIRRSIPPSPVPAPASIALLPVALVLMLAGRSLRRRHAWR